jgi:hypothetical protein
VASVQEYIEIAVDSQVRQNFNPNITGVIGQAQTDMFYMPPTI